MAPTTREAEARGCATQAGLGMFADNGAIVVRHWTGVDPDTVVTRRTLADLFER